MLLVVQRAVMCKKKLQLKMRHYKAESFRHYISAQTFYVVYLLSLNRILCSVCTPYIKSTEREGRECRTAV